MAALLPIEKADRTTLFNVHHVTAQVIERFNDSALVIERDIIEFIDTSFRSLRSCEAAFDMVLNFKHIQTRTSISVRVAQKKGEILLQFQKEVCVILKFWQFCKIHP